MSIAQLRQWAENFFWPKELSYFSYGFPVKERPDPEATKVLSRGIPASQLKYLGPFLTASSPETHIGPFLHAIDFLIHDGTEVIAANSGEVVEAVDGNVGWGDGEEYRHYLNFLTVKCTHETTVMEMSQDDEMTRVRKEIVEYHQYCHLEPRSLLVKVGDFVSKGQLLAKIGKSGWTDRDHLHFVVFKMTEEYPSKFVSLVPRFEL